MNTEQAKPAAPDNKLSREFGIETKSPALRKLWIARISITALAIVIALAWVLLK